MVQLQFNDYVGGIEDGIIGVLTARRKVHPDHPDRYLKDIGSYGGELDENTLRETLNEVQDRIPLALVGYTDGEDTLMPATAPVFGQPRTYRHDCSFAIIAVAEDARGGTAQRRGAAGSVGVYQMLADFRQDLSGLWLIRKGDTIVTRAGDRPLAADEQLLTFDPLKPADAKQNRSSIQFIARLPEMTAYAVVFDTWFEWTEDDRRGGTTPVTELIFEATVRDARNRQIEQLPGVTVE